MNLFYCTATRHIQKQVHTIYHILVINDFVSHLSLYQAGLRNSNAIFAYGIISTNFEKNLRTSYPEIHIFITGDAQLKIIGFLIDGIIYFSPVENYHRELCHVCIFTL